jgi:hypothetical protein
MRLREIKNFVGIEIFFVGGCEMFAVRKVSGTIKIVTLL